MDRVANSGHILEKKISSPGRWPATYNRYEGLIHIGEENHNFMIFPLISSELQEISAHLAPFWKGQILMPHNWSQFDVSGVFQNVPVQKAQYSSYYSGSYHRFRSNTPII